MAPYGSNAITQTYGIGKLSIGTSMNRVDYGTKGTQMYQGDMSTQTFQIHPSEVGAITNLPLNNLA